MSKLEILNKISNKVNIAEFDDLDEEQIARKLIDMNTTDDDIMDTIDQLRDLIDPLDNCKFKLKFVRLVPLVSMDSDEPPQQNALNVNQLHLVLNDFFKENIITDFTLRLNKDMILGTNNEVIYDKIMGMKFVTSHGIDVYKIENFEGKSRLKYKELKNLISNISNSNNEINE